MATKKRDTQRPEMLSFPTNIVPADKTEEKKWAEQMADAIIQYGHSCFNSRDNNNFKYAQGEVPLSEFDHITKLYSNPNNKRFNKILPAKIRQVNAIAHMLNRVVGKVDAQDVKFNASVVNEDAVSTKLEDLSAEATKKLTRMARQTADVTTLLGMPLVEGDDVEPMNPQEVEEMNLSTWQQENEIQVSKALNYLMKKKNNYMKYKFSHQGLYGYLITGKMGFDTLIDLDEPNAQCIDPRFLIYDRSNNSPFIQHGRFAGYYYNGTPQEIIDRCPELEKADVDYLDEISSAFKNATLKGESPEWYIDEDVNLIYMNCYKVYWKALKRVKVKITPNRFDEDNPHVHFIGDDEDANEEKGESIEYRYISVIYECEKLGGRVYYQCRELPNQFIPNDMPAERELPIAGIIDENPCILDLLKPLQNMRIQCFYAIERLVGQAKGKILIVDEAIEENGPENLYNMMAFSVYKINTAKEGEQQLYNGQAGFLAPKEVDMGLSTAVNDLMRMVAFIDQNMNMVTGMGEPYQGVVKSDQGLGVTQTAIEQAQLTLQPYYSVYYTVVEMVLQNLCNLMRPAWADRPKTAYFLGDKGFEFFNLKPDMNWSLDQYGVFVENSVSSNQVREFMIKMATQLLPISKEPEMALSVIKMFNSKSAAEAEEIFEKGIRAMQVMKQREQEFAQQQQAAATEAVVRGNDQKNAMDHEKNLTILAKEEIAQKGETVRKAMEISHKEDMQETDYNNLMNTKIADHLLNARAANLETQEV